jgi:hypothetical protein
MPLRDLATKIDSDITVVSDEIIDTRKGYSSTFFTLTKNTTRLAFQHGNDSSLSDAANVNGAYLIVGDSNGTITGETTTAGTQATVTDTTTYPVTAQATNTEKVTVDGGAEQTVTFTTAINVGNVTDTTIYPVADQDTKTEKITLDGGTEQTITFAGATTTATHVATQIDAQLVGGSAAVVSGQVVVTSDTVGATSAVAIGTGTTDLTWDTPATVNTAAGIASELNSQLYGCVATVASGQVVLTSLGYGTLSVMLIGTGTTALTWDTPVAGTGGTGSYVAYTGAASGQVGYVGKRRYVRMVVTNPATDTTIMHIKGSLLSSPEN